MNGGNASIFTDRRGTGDRGGSYFASETIKGLRMIPQPLFPRFATGFSYLFGISIEAGVDPP
jgi:hypothetical protein